MPNRIMCVDKQIIRHEMDPKDYKRIIYDPGRVTRIILNRPRYLNTTSHAELAELEDAFDRATVDENCHVIVLSGAGRCFCSGDDNIGHTPESAPTLWDGDARPPDKLMEQYGSETEVWRQYNTEHDYYIGWPFLKKLRSIPKPTIAMVHGYAIYMGFMICEAMDMVFASEDALFLTGAISPQLVWTLGPRKALEIGFEHRFLTAREAQELNMINRVYPDFETLEKETMAFAYRVAYESPIGLRRMKEAYLNMMEIFSFSTANEMGRTPYRDFWRHAAEEGHRVRYEGMGQARSPVALCNLKLKLETEGKEVPAHVEAAIARAIERDDKAGWQRALHQEWRDPERVTRAEASAQRYEEMRAEDERILRAECERRGLNYEDMQPPWDKIQKSKASK